MYTTLALLVAAGHVVNAQESPFSYSPRATTSDDNLATITTLVDGHLPTCFTGHPTAPCPTEASDDKRDLTHDLNSAARIVPIDPISMTAGQGSHSLPTDVAEPAVVERDAPLTVANKDYIPRPSEWAIPQNFTFTDTISQNKTGTAATTGSLTTSSSQVASSTAAAHSDSYLKSENNYFNRGDTYLQRMNITAMIESLTQGMAPQGTGAPAAHSPLPTGGSLLQDSNATNAAVNPTGSTPSVTEQASILPAIASQGPTAHNTSSTAHLSGTIGTLLSQAMFPGEMRAPSTSQTAAPATTQAPDPKTEHIVPIPMSQRPNTTAPDATLQAFVHTINTADLPASQSSDATLPTPASATTESSAALPVESGEAQLGEKLHQYLHHQIIPAKVPTAVSNDVPTTSSSESTMDATPVAMAKGNDTQAITRINSATVTLTQAQPTATPYAHASAHHHPRARRFIS